MEERSKNIPNCLKKYRKARGLKQQDVARILGIKSASMISRWEKGVCMPSAINLFKLAALYRVMVDPLFVDQLRKIKMDIYKKEEKITNHAKRTGI